MKLNFILIAAQYLHMSGRKKVSISLYRIAVSKLLVNMNLSVIRYTHKDTDNLEF